MSPPDFPHSPPRRAPLVIVMGVSGSGKTTVGKLLADHWGVDFFDADDFHPAANVAKMETGQPLNDEDRLPWLQALNRHLQQEAPRGAVLGCSALKATYREILEMGVPQLHWVYLRGSRELILRRMQARRDHFMPPSLLDSQLATLEPPDDALAVDIDKEPEAIVEEILSKW